MARLGDLHWYAGDPPAHHDGAWELCVKRHDLARGAQWGGPVMPEGSNDADAERAWDALTFEWWESTMPALVREAGFDPAWIGADGRSSGWLVCYKRGPFRYIEDYGGIDGLDPNPTTGEGNEDRAILAERFLNLRVRVEELGRALVESMPTAADLTERVAENRDERLLHLLSAGTVCPNCGEPIMGDYAMAET